MGIIEGFSNFYTLDERIKSNICIEFLLIVQTNRFFEIQIGSFNLLYRPHRKTMQQVN